MQVLQSAELAYALRDKSVERTRRVACGRIVGITVLAVIYSIVLYASIGLFQASPTDAHRAAYRLIGTLNVIVLPLLILTAVIGVRRIWRDGAPHGHYSRLLTAPLWISFIVSLLTVPIWMGQANTERQGSQAVGLGSVATFLLAPWGFMLAYGLSLFVICAMFDFTFPVQTETTAQPNATAHG